MIKLTTPAGKPVFILKSWVQLIREPTPREYGSQDVGCVLVLSGITQAVRESLDKVRLALE